MIKNFFYIGTSGYFYKDWLKTIYKGEKDLLKVYEKYLNALEINSTFYRLPSFSSIKNYQKYNLCYIFKLNRKVTHYKNFDKETLGFFVKIKEILKESYKGILAQFPPYFPSKEENKDFLLKLKDYFLKENIYVFFELRHISWENELNFFKENKINVIKAYFPNYLKWSKAFNFEDNKTYFRVHGFRKLYFDDVKDKLEDIKNDILKLKKQENFIFFNNTLNGYAFYNALKLKEILDVVSK